MLDRPGIRLRKAITVHKPLILAGVVNAYCALLADKAGIPALYLSGAGVANACFGLPDLGLTSLDDVAEEVRRITYVTSTPLIVDADTGWGSPLNAARTVKILSKAGAAGIHIEDQPFEKRCGHRQGKVVIPPKEMIERISAAANAKEDDSFLLIARTDALAVEGLNDVISRVKQYIEAGADAIFLEAVTEIGQYRQVKDHCPVPLIANLTEFGKTPSWTAQEVSAHGADIALFPLSIFRAMSFAAQNAYELLKNQGSTKELLPQMQNRAELYSVLNYEKYEKQMDAWLEKYRSSP
ncbi:MAG: methylisocitrate lyase [Parachlamydiales bacterium]|jgi:methylisocitrate lyase